MKKHLSLFFLIIFIGTQKAFAAVEATTPELEKALKSSTNEPNVMTILFALLFVVALIYITGIIYSKLNFVGSKTVREQLKNYDLNRATIISTTPLGQGKNLHVIELNKKSYLIGATQHSITLIKELENIEIQVPSQENDIKSKQPPEETFDVHRKYL